MTSDMDSNYLIYLANNLVQAGTGCCDYTQGSKALGEVTVYITALFTSVVSLTGAIAAILTLYSSISIYIKWNHGEDGITKSVTMLVGAALFMLSANIILPAFFGYSFRGNWIW